MRLTRIQCTHFRNLENLDFSLNQDFIILTGPNGAGKTNFLESIFYASQLRAFPPGRGWELIGFGSDYFRLRLEAGGKVLEYYYGRKDEKHFLRSQSTDGVRKKFSEMAGALPSVRFLPQDLNVLQFSPGMRRDFMDDVLTQTNTSYRRFRGEYDKILVQRNELLSRIISRQAKPAELDFWDQALAAAAAAIRSARQTLSVFFNQGLSDLYRELTGSTKILHFQYLTEFTGQQLLSANDFEQALNQARAHDCATGITSVGPHRDDWRVTDSKQNLAHFLSRGEQRSVIMALKIREREYIKSTLKQEPILLLDELLAELDGERGEQMLRYLYRGPQIFLTTTSADEIPKTFREAAQVLHLA